MNMRRVVKKTLAALAAVAGLACPALAAEQPYDVALEYIESDGTQYLDTGLVLSNDVSVSLSFALVSGTDWYSKVFGSRDAASSRNISCVFQYGGLLVDFNNGDCLTYRASPEQDAADPWRRMDILISSAVRHVNRHSPPQHLGGNENNNTAVFHTSYTVRIFDIAGPDGTPKNWNKVAGRLYSLTISAGDVPLRDYQPCIKAGVVGLYDRVTRTFLKPEEGNPLIPGPVVVTPPQDVVRDEGAPAFRVLPAVHDVDYIESDGVAYLDTGLKLTSSMSVDIVFSLPAAVEGLSSGIFGSRSSATSKNIALSSFGSMITVDFSNAGSYDSYRAQCFGYSSGLVYSVHLGADSRVVRVYETGVSQASNTNVWSGAFETPTSAYVFKTGGTDWKTPAAKVYSLVITDGSEVIRDYRPCSSNGIACLHDRVGGGFLCNANPNGGVLKAGPAREVPRDESLTVDGTTATGQLELTDLGQGAVACDIYAVTKQAPDYDYAVAYLESDGANCIDTGLVISNDMEVTITYAITDFSNGPAGVFGSRSDVNTCNVAISYADSSRISCDFVSGGSYETYRVSLHPTTLKKVYTSILSAQKRSLGGYSNDELMPVTGWCTPGTAWIFGTQNAGWRYAKARLYALRIEQGGKTIRDYQPCVKDTVPCLFDRIERTFLYNSGSSGHPFRAGEQLDPSDRDYIDGGWRDGARSGVVTTLVCSANCPTSKLFTIPNLQPGTRYACQFLAVNRTGESRCPAVEGQSYAFTTKGEAATLALSYGLTRSSRLALTVKRTEGTGATRLHAVYGTACAGDDETLWEHDEVVGSFAADETEVEVKSPRLVPGVNYLRLYTEDGAWSQTILVPGTGLGQKDVCGLMLLLK